MQGRAGAVIVVVARLLGALGDRDRWLLIYDNAEAPPVFSHQVYRAFQLVARISPLIPSYRKKHAFGRRSRTRVVDHGADLYSMWTRF